MSDTQKPKPKTLAELKEELARDYDWGSKNLTDDQTTFLAFCYQSAGLVATAARLSKMSRRNHYYWAKENPDYADAFDDIKEGFKDIAESKIFEHVQNGDKTMLIFFAKTQMKDRGYVERFEHVPASDFDKEFEGKDAAQIANEILELNQKMLNATKGT